MTRKFGLLAAGLIACAALLAFAPRPATAQGTQQGWFQTGTGLGISKVRLAVPDLASRSAAAQPLEKTFHDVLWSDLGYSGIVDLVSSSFYPLQVPSQPSELHAQDWAAAPANAYMVAYGNLTVDGTNLAAAGFLSDVHNPASPPAIQKIYRGSATDSDARRLAHQFADDIIAALSGGLPGIAQTQIAYESARSGYTEIWAMDYDGANQHQLTHQRSISLTPRWSPDSTRIAFTCYEPYGRATAAEICIYSLASNHLIAFPRYPGTNSSPAWSPDGSKIAFMASLAGYPEVYVADAGGAHMRRITFAAGVSTSPAWNPKTGNQIAFISDRDGTPGLYIANSDGTNVQKMPLPDMQYVSDPAWSPNGQLLAFSWRRPEGNYDIYVMDIVSHELVQLTANEGRNERPSWAPDGRHLVFESTRTGKREVWTMLADGSQPRQLTFEGQNGSPNWSQR